MKYKTNALGQQVVDDIVVIENKLSSTTPLTTPQSTAFTKISYKVRNQVKKFSEFGTGKELKYNQELKFDTQIKWYKVHDGTNGDVISGINKM